MSEIISSKMQLPQKENDNKLQEEIDALRIEFAEYKLHSDIQLDIVRDERNASLSKVNQLEEQIKHQEYWLQEADARLAHVTYVELKDSEQKNTESLKRIIELEQELQITSGASAEFEAAFERTRKREDILIQELADTRQELQMVLDDWNDMVRAIQSPAHGTALAHAKILVRDFAAAREKIAELETKITDSVFSCPSCGRHDFGFFAPKIKAACGNCMNRAMLHYNNAKTLRNFLSTLRSRLVSPEDLHDLDEVLKSTTISEEEWNEKPSC